MDLVADTWYPLADILDGPSIPLRDGSTIRHSHNTFGGGGIEMLEGDVIPRFHYRQFKEIDDEASSPKRYLQLTLRNVANDDITPSLKGSSIAAQLLKEQVVCLGGARYSHDIHLRYSGGEFRAAGSVCLNLLLGDAGPGDDNIQRKVQEVQTAFQRGLLDRYGKSRADFRLMIKPITRKLSALHDAGYLPNDAWRADVIFGYWREMRSGDVMPIPDDPVDRWYIRFATQYRKRDFRITDLFSTGAAST